MPEQALIEKIRSLPPDKVAEIEDFVDFLRQRDEERRLVQSTAVLSQESFRKVWDNPDDAECDRMLQLAAYQSSTDGRPVFSSPP